MWKHCQKQLETKPNGSTVMRKLQKMTDHHRDNRLENAEKLTRPTRRRNNQLAN